MDPITWAYWLAAVVSAATAVAAWGRRHDSRAAVGLSAAAGAAAVWSAGLALVRLGGPPQLQTVLAAVVFLAVGATVAGVWGLSRQLADHSWRPSGRVVAFLAIEPTLAWVAMLTNPWHGLMLTAAPAGSSAPFGPPGPLFWVLAVWCYVLEAWALVAIVRARHRAFGPFRRQLSSLLVALMVPVAGNLVSMAVLSVDTTPILFVLSAVIAGWAVFRQGLLRIVPVAREQVVDTISDGVVVLDPQRRVVDVNHAALALMRRTHPDLPEDVIGLPAHQVLAHGDEEIDLGHRRLIEPIPGLFLDVRGTALRNPRGRPLGWVLVARDVTESMAQQRELAFANDALREHLSTIDRLRAALAEEAVRDALTGLYNRRHLIAALDRAVIGWRVYGEPVSLVLVDVDHFKTVNDSYGHPVGDDALRAIARAVQAEARAGDTVARYGGEELVVLLPGADATTAAARAERIRARCAGLALRSGESVFSVTISAGVAAVPEHGHDAAALLIAADTALYAAKDAGRDRVVVAGDLPARQRLTSPR